MILAAELVLVIGVLFQGVALLFLDRKKLTGFSEIVFVVGLIVAAITVLWSMGGANGSQDISIILDYSLFRLPRATLILSAVLLGRLITVTSEIPKIRKPEVLFLVTILVLLCDVLLLSRHLTLSMLLLLMICWTCIFLSGLAYRGKLEGEAVLKFWLQASLSLVLGLGSLVVLTFVAGGVHYDQIAALAKATSQYSVQSIFLIQAVFLPFMLAMGLFPFHFALLDRDHGVAWAIQGLLGVLVQGAIALALWKVSIEVFGHSSGAQSSDGTNFLQYFGIAGGYALLIFALSQENSKRLLAAILGASWSIILAAGAVPSAQTAAAIAYAFAGVFLWGALLSFIWSRMQESVRSENISSVFGLGKKYRTSGLILLVALAGPLCVPIFPGFPSVLHLLGAIIQQKVLSLLVFEVTLIALLCFTAAKLVSDILFRERGDSCIVNESILVHYSKLDVVSITVMVGVMLALGLFWSQVFEVLLESAKAFL